jgi:hypothetical protein
MSIPDSSIIGIKPTIEQISPEVKEVYKKTKAKGLAWAYAGDKIKRCCICDDIATKIVRYPIQGATRIERYCDRCASNQFSRVENK